MRKHRRKIQKRKRSKKRTGRKGLIYRHYNSPVTDKYIKITTDTMIVIEALFLVVCTVWATIEIFLRFPDLLARLR